MVDLLDTVRRAREQRALERQRRLPIHELTVPEILAIVRSAPADPVRWSQRERQAWRELSMRN